MEVAYSKQAERFLNGQDDKTFNRIVNAVDKLPVGDVKKMQGEDGLYRLRVGSCRVIFKRNDGQIWVEKIDNCGQVYKH